MLSRHPSTHSLCYKEKNNQRSRTPAHKAIGLSEWWLSRKCGWRGSQAGGMLTRVVWDPEQAASLSVHISGKARRKKNEVKEHSFRITTMGSYCYFMNICLPKLAKLIEAVEFATCIK